MLDRKRSDLSRKLLSVSKETFTSVKKLLPVSKNFYRCQKNLLVSKKFYFFFLKPEVNSCSIWKRSDLLQKLLPVSKKNTFTSVKTKSKSFSKSHRSTVARSGNGVISRAKVRSVQLTLVKNLLITDTVANNILLSFCFAS